MTDRSKRPPGEALADLRRRLALLSPRDPARSEVIARAAEAYGVSIWTIYRALRELTRPKPVRRADHGSTRPAAAVRYRTTIFEFEGVSGHRREFLLAFQQGEAYLGLGAQEVLLYLQLSRERRTPRAFRRGGRHARRPR
jgi:hypothetical protein